MLSEASTSDEAYRQEEKVILISDVSRAFFEAPATRKIAVALPDEALEEHEKGRNMVGSLKTSLYGTARSCSSAWVASRRPARPCHLWAATHAPTTLLRSTAASRRPWSAFADPILGLRGGPRSMYPDLADEASEELASDARISARRAVAFDPAQYVLNCTGANASPTLARTRLTEVARSLGAAPAPAQVVG